MIQELMATIKQLIRRVSVLESQIELPDMAGFLAIDGSNANTTIDIQGQSLVNVGNLGVGTDNPSETLDVVGSVRISGINDIRISPGTAFSIDLLDFKSGNTDKPTGFRMIPNGTATKTQFELWNGSNLSDSARVNVGVDGDTMKFEPYIVGTGTPIDKIVFSSPTTSFRVGIGVDTPLSKLQVKGTADEIQQIVQANSTQTVNLTEWQNSSGVPMSAMAKNGAFKPAALADSAAENNTLYYSTTASKLVYKDAAGVVNNLY